MVYAETAAIFMTGAREDVSNKNCGELYIKLLHDKLVSLPGYWTELKNDQWNGIHLIKF